MAQRERKATWSTWAVLLLVVGTGLALVSLTMRAVSFSQLRASQNWIAVPCEVTKLSVSPGSSKTVRVVYSYHYGQAYVGDRVDFGPTQGDIGGVGAAGVLKEIRERKCSCFVDPTRPERSVLFRRVNWFGPLDIFALLLSVCAVALALVAQGSRRRASN